MERDYKNEAAWKKKKYWRRDLFIDKELGKKFDEKLKKENLSYADWARERIHVYLKE